MATPGPADTPIMDEAEAIYIKLVLSHPMSGALACYMISDGTSNPEMAETANSLWRTALAEAIVTTTTTTTTQ